MEFRNNIQGTPHYRNHSASSSLNLERRQLPFTSLNLFSSLSQPTTYPSTNNANMSRRAGATATSDQNQNSSSPRKHASTEKSPDQGKQAMLLAQDAGHFSMIRALHLADLITEMNGKCIPPPPAILGLHPPYSPASSSATNNHTDILRRILRLHVHPLLDAVLPEPRSNRSNQPLARLGLHPLRSVLRLLRRQSRTLARQIQPHGPRARFSR